MASACEPESCLEVDAKHVFDLSKHRASKRSQLRAASQASKLSGAFDFLPDR